VSAFQPALCSVTFRGLAPAAVADLAAEAGLAAIEWGGDVHAPAGDEARAREVRAIAEERGLAVASYGSYVRPPADGLEAFARSLDSALALGAPTIRIWPGSQGRASTDYGRDERARTAELIAAMAARAAAAGVAIALEYHPGTLTDETASAQALMREIGHANVYLYWQPRPGLGGDEALDEVARVGREVSHIHVFEWDAEKRRYPLRRGAEGWRRIIGAMPPSRWAGPRYAMLEFVAGDDPARFFKDAATLRDLLSG